MSDASDRPPDFDDDLFGRDNVKIVRTQDLETEPASVVDDVLRIRDLGVIEIVIEMTKT